MVKSPALFYIHRTTHVFSKKSIGHANGCIPCSKNCFIWYSASRGSRITELEVTGDDDRDSEKYAPNEERVEPEEEDIKAFKRVDVVVPPLTYFQLRELLVRIKNQKLRQ